MKKQIQPPSNWQDFEDLCERIFGEIWNCKHTIKKHGRSGQGQFGVDVYGFPDGGTELFGVQCKGKDNNLRKGLTVTEIDQEIEKAKEFDPTLSVFIFATTAPKDAKIEKYVIKKHLESVKSGGFEILLFDWEDLADKIRRNENLNNWYLKNQQFEVDKSIRVLFNGEEENLKISRKLKMTRYVLLPPEYEKLNNPALDKLNFPDIFKHAHLDPFRASKINHSWTEIELEIENIGSTTIEDWKFWVEFGDDIDKISDNHPKGIVSLSIGSGNQSVIEYEDENKLLCIPHKDKPIVPNDTKKFSWSFLAKPETIKTKVKWKLVSRNHSIQGEVNVEFQPEYEKEFKSVKTEEELKATNDKQISYLIKDNIR